MKIINIVFKNLCLLLFILLSFNITAQNAIVGSGFSTGWGAGSCTPMNSNNFSYFVQSFGNSFIRITNGNSTGVQYFRLGVDWDNNFKQLTITPGQDISIETNTEYQLNSNCTTSGAMYINVSNTAHNYVFKTQDAGVNPVGKFIVFNIDGNIRNVTSVSQSPVVVNSTQNVIVTATLDGPLNSGQGVYLRYTTNNFTSSTVVAMSGSGNSYMATIPTQNNNTNVSYYVFTSDSGLTISHQNADFYTINGNTNQGNNYSYTVEDLPSYVTISPAFPTDDIPVTVTFNATDTPLAGASKVYFHSGISTSESQPKLFQNTVGNWGQDDGIGEMMSLASNLWTITLPSLRQYYNVREPLDIFGMNFLFRSATGAARSDNDGKNYYTPTDPGNYFTITSPQILPFFTDVNVDFDIIAEANVSADEWRLIELNPNDNSVIDTIDTDISGGVIYNQTQQVSGEFTRRFKIEAKFGNNYKYKILDATGVTPPSIQTRPSWVRAGVNYHEDDPTKATLVLHCPTFTRFYNGLGDLTGTNPAAPKQFVYVIGDFNDWTVLPAYKMNRDTGAVDNRGDYFWLELSELTPGKEYVFQYLIDGVLQLADPYTHKVSDFDDVFISSDIYPDLIPYPSQAQDRASVLQTNKTAYVWTADSFSKPTTNNLNIYELHFRDFT